MHARFRTLQGEELDLQIPGIKMCASKNEVDSS